MEYALTGGLEMRPPGERPKSSHQKCEPTSRATPLEMVSPCYFYRVLPKKMRMALDCPVQKNSVVRLEVTRQAGPVSVNHLLFF